MGGKASKPQNEPDFLSGNVEPPPLPQGRSFPCRLQDSGAQFLITIGFPNLYLSNEKREIIYTFPIKYLRGYGQQNNIFSFETGRKCEGGAKTYYYIIDNDEDVFLALNEAVAEHNRGVGGDRYDHLPNHKSQSNARRIERPNSIASSASSFGSNTYDRALPLPTTPTSPSQGQTYDTLHSSGTLASKGRVIGDSNESDFGFDESYASLQRQMPQTPSEEQSYSVLHRGGGTSFGDLSYNNAHLHLRSWDNGYTMANPSKNGTYDGVGAGYDAAERGNMPPPMKEYSHFTHGEGHPTSSMSYNTLNRPDPSQGCITTSVYPPTTRDDLFLSFFLISQVYSNILSSSVLFHMTHTQFSSIHFRGVW